MLTVPSKTRMLHDCLIDTVITMLNNIAPYKKCVYAILNTLHKITKTLASTSQKLTILEFEVFENRQICLKIYGKNYAGR